MSTPLDGVRVVDFGQFIAAPAATQVLADLGADVIKVEPIHGESSRSIGIYGDAILRNYNRNKRCIALDLKDVRGQQVARELIAGADIVVQTSKYRAGLDIAAQAESGIMWVTGEADREPQRVGFPVVDAAAAHVFAQAILGAYIRRLRTGDGDTVETSLLEVAVHLQGPNWGEYLLTGNDPVRKGNGQATVAPAADVMPTRDGAIVVSAYSVVHFDRLCNLLGHPELASDPRFETNESRVRNRPALLEELRSEFAKMTSDEAMTLLTPNGVVAGRISSYREVHKNPDVEAAGIFIDVTDPTGVEHTTLGSPWHLHSIPRFSTTGAPALGQHTVELLTELGYTAAAIDDLATTGVVCSRKA
ncbi:CaiB/BaiF CoA transferase family protein [Rhodococcus opacus]|uniref:CaiB/BaiF CoA transferase family protein n=1 Tax=Rhodococcus opacus TaxID=37919 RepID=UPI001B301F2B|nr:CoA transferase [Rhodococcus opacus]